MKPLTLCALCTLLFLGCRTSEPESPAALQAREEKQVAARAERARRDELNRQLPDGWIHGTLTASDGTVLPFRIEKKRAWRGHATGGVAAKHPNGEVFRGTYAGILPRSHGHVDWTTGPSPNGITRFHSANIHTQGQNASAIASLTGDKGTVIQLSLTILAGFRPHGIGGGQDNKGIGYQVQF